MQTIQSSLRQFVNDWNRGEQEKACDIYTSSAVIRHANVTIRNKKMILQYYKSRFPERRKMGRVSLRILKIRRLLDKNVGPVTAIVRWTLLHGRKKVSGSTYLIFDRTGQRPRIAAETFLD